MPAEQIAKIKSGKLEPTASDKMDTEEIIEMNSGGGWWPFQTAFADKPPLLEGTQDIWEAQVNRDHPKPNTIIDNWDIWGTKASRAEEPLGATAQPICNQELNASQNSVWDPQTRKTVQGFNGKKGIKFHKQEQVLENKQEDEVIIRNAEYKTDARCQARFREDMLWYDAKITATHADGTVDVEFGDETKQTRCEKEEIAAAVRLPMNTTKFNSDQSSLPALIPDKSDKIIKFVS